MKKYALLMALAAGWILMAGAQNLPLQTLIPPVSLPPEQPLHVIQDGEGYLWYGSTGTGLCRFDGYESEMFRSDRQRPDLLLSNDILCIAEQRPNAEIWFGTKKGAYILDKHDYSIRPVVIHSATGTQQNGAAARNELSDKRISHILTAKDGSVWLTYRNQLLHLSAEAGLLERYETSWRRKNRSITCLCFDAGNTLWLGLWNGGLAGLKQSRGKRTLEDGVWTRTDYPEEMEWMTQRKVLLIKTSAGTTLLYDPQTQQLALPDAHDLRSLEADAPSSGALRISWIDSVMHRQGPRNDSDVLSWAVVGDSDAYVGSYHSLFRCDPAHVERLQGDLDKVRSMAYSERLQTLFLLSRARGVCAWKDGRLTVLNDTAIFRFMQLQGDTSLWLSDGLSKACRLDLRTHQLTTDTVGAEVRVLGTAYLFDGRKQLMGYGQRELVVPRETELVEIYLSTLDYEHASRVQLAYRLGTDGAWTELPVGAHIARFTHLPSGRHPLQVRATDAYGRWSPPVTVVSLMRPFAWYARPWFWLLLAVVLPGVLYTLYIKRVRAPQTAASPSEEAPAEETPSEEAPVEEDTRISVADREFREKAVAAVMNNITNTEYSVDALASDLCMSRGNLHRKMRSIVGLTPTDFIRNQRLERAAHLLRTTSHSVNEIADMVGFSYASYFTKCFKEKYGVLPKDY